MAEHEAPLRVIWKPRYALRRREWERIDRIELKTIVPIIFLVL